MEQGQPTSQEELWMSFKEHRELLKENLFKSVQAGLKNQGACSKYGL